jgi:hypothetical protein
MNFALYGEDFGSYPFRLGLIDSENGGLLTFFSGQLVSRPFKIGLYDQEGQLITSDSHSEGIVYSKDIKVQISGNNKLIAKNGVFEFKDLYL